MKISAKTGKVIFWCWLTFLSISLVYAYLIDLPDGYTQELMFYHGILEELAKNPDLEKDLLEVKLSLADEYASIYLYDTFYGHGISQEDSIKIVKYIVLNKIDKDFITFPISTISHFYPN